ncbi:MAG TPA: hypothetical protein VFG42_08000 [Baekduia sp.]|uniref:hypothetical protein n=1 Tax=Baekduia sp. TaxID=2600305 RepID=UPI002D77387B|nr:hypothetical protein [Baekduia sp.]HET6506717.1 hypothetical protein [Baekduia sp.]
MGLLFRLPLLIFEWLLRRVLGGGDDRYAAAAAGARPAPPPDPPFVGETGAPAATAATAAPPSTAAEPPLPTVEEVLARREDRDATATAGSVTPLRPISESDDGHVDTEPSIVESFGPSDDVGDRGGTITVDEPWDGYASQSASSIVTRLRGADAATKAVVALYERGHKNRATVLRATG